MVPRVMSSVDMSGVTRLGVDETAARRGHDYITLFMDMDVRRLLFGTPGRDHTTIAAFKADLEAHGGDPSQIGEACIDMSNAFIKGLAAHFPKAHLTFDRFHVMKLMGEAVDKVRRQELKERPELKKTRYWWLKNPENLRVEQRERLRELQAMNLKTSQAYQMKLTLQDFYEQANPRAAATLLEDWCEMAAASALEPVQKVAQTLKEHAAGVLRWFSQGLTNGHANAEARPGVSLRRVVDLPQGTVTYLFTDVQGSTRLWEISPELMMTVLGLHDEVIDRVVGLELGADEKSFLCLPEDWLRHSDGTTFCSELCEARFYLCRFEEKVKMLEAKYHIAVEAEIENE